MESAQRHEVDEAVRLAPIERNNTQPRQSDHSVVTSPSDASSPPSTLAVSGSNTGPMNPPSMGSSPQAPKAEVSSVAPGNGFAHETQPQRGLLLASTSPEADTAPVPSSEINNNNAASNTEASRADNAKRDRVAARVVQLRALLQEEGDEFSPHIQSLEDLDEFEQALEVLRADGQQPDLSAGYPLAKADFAAHCRVLFRAMKNLDDVLDGVAAPGRGSRASPARGGGGIALKFNRSKKSIEFLIVAGKLMRAMRKAQRGRLSVSGKKFCKYGNFTQRFQAVVDALNVSKLLVRSAFESDEWVDRIAINPDEELRRKKQNKVLNDTKSVKQKFADMLKKKDPSINFKDARGSGPTQPGTRSAVQTPADQAQQGRLQQSEQGSAVSSPQIRTAADRSLTTQPSKRVKMSHDQADQSEPGSSPSNESSSNNQQQHSGGESTEQSPQNPQASRGGHVDDEPPALILSDESARSPTDKTSEQRGQPGGPPSPGMPAPAGLRGPGGRQNGRVAHAPRSGRLNLDPDPLSVPGPIRDYALGPYGAASPGLHGRPPSGRAGFLAVAPPDEGQCQDEDHSPVYYDS